MDTPSTSPDITAPRPADGADLTQSVQPSATGQAPARRPRGRPRKAVTRKDLERELTRLRRQARPATTAPTENAPTPAEAPAESSDPFAEAPRPAPGSAPLGSEAASAPAPGEAPTGDGSTPELPIGEAGARALAPTYYGLVNAVTALALTHAPAFKARPDEAKRIAAAVALDARAGSADREVIDPPLIAVMSKMTITPEVALIVATGSVLLAKYAQATGSEAAASVIASIGG